MRKLTAALIALTVLAMFGCASKEQTGMKIYVQQKLYDKAIEQGATALQQNPQSGDTHYFIGAAYFGKDQELDPEAPGYADSSEKYMSKAYEHFTAAKHYAEADWGLDADNNIVSMFGRHYNLGVIAAKKGDHATAAMEYRLASVGDPENFKGYYAHAGSVWELAREAKKNGDDAEFEELSQVVIDDLDKVIELGTDDQETTIAVYQTMGDVQYYNGHLDKAQVAYQKAIALSPENYNLMITMGERFYNENDYEHAAAMYQDAMSVKERLNLVDPDDASVYSSLGHSLSQLNRREEAIAAYQKVLELTPEDRDTKYNIMVTFYKSGEQAEKDGNTTAAKQYYSRAIEIGNELIGMDPSKPEYWQVRGLCKRGLGDFAGAARDLKEFRDLRSSSE
jgi:tetratricopeptide (TPR) repeat protein